MIRERMRRAGLTLLAVMLLAGRAVAQEAPTPVAVATFSYSDTSGEPRDQEAEHAAWLAMFTGLMREDIGRTGRFRIVDHACAAPDCAVVEGVVPDALVASASAAGARYLVFGGIHKMSTLVQWARLTVLDVPSRAMVIDRQFSFRGDNEDAWRHAARYVSSYVNGIAVTK